MMNYFLRRHWDKLLLTICILAYAVFFSYLAVMRHERLLSTGYDLGNYDQALWTTAHGGLLEFTTWKGKDNWFRYPTRLGMHVEPILFLIVPLYWIWPDVRLLLILQAVIVSLGAWGLWLLARWKSSAARPDASAAERWAALLLAMAFLLNPALQLMLLGDFHGVALAAGFVPFAIYFMLRRKYLWFTFFAMLIALSKEEMPLFVALMGLYIFIFQGVRSKEAANRRRSIILGGAVFLFGIAWSAVAFLVIIPHFNTGGASPYASRYDAILGDGGLSLAVLPRLVLAISQTALDHGVFDYLRRLLQPTAFLALFDIPLLLIGGVSFAINILSDFPTQRTVGFHYVAALIPLINAATVTGIANLVAYLRNDRHRISHWIPAGIRGAPVRRWWLALSIVAFLFTMQAQYDHGFTPIARRFSWPTVTDHQRLAQRFFDEIPGDASVTTQQMLAPHLTHRWQLTLFPYDLSGEYYLIDILRNWPMNTPEGNQWLLDNVVNAPGYGIVDAADGYILLRHGAEKRPIPKAFYTVFLAPDAAPGYPAQVDFGDDIRFLGFDVDTEGNDPEFVLYFQALHPLKQDYFITLYLANAQYRLAGAAEATQPDLLWFPTSKWPVGKTVRIAFRYFGWDTSSMQEWAVALGVLDGRDVWNPKIRLSPNILEYSQNPRLLGDGTLLHLMRFQQRRGSVVPAPDPVLTAIPTDAEPVSVTFDNLAKLEGYRLPAGKMKPGEQMIFSLYWRALAETETSYTVFTQLLGPDGRLYGQHDSPPGYDTLPTNRWSKGQLIPDEHRFIIATDALPGDYQLLVGFYDPADGQRVSRGDGSGDYFAIPLAVVK